MRRLLAIALAALVAAGAAGAAYRPSPLLPLDGAYRLGDGTILSLAVTPDGGVLYTNTRTGELRQLTPTGKNTFTFGPSYLVAGPVRGRILVKGTALTLTTAGSTRTARRVAVKRATVSFAGAGVRLTGKVTSPATAGKHPAVVILHGSEAGDRDSYDLIVNFYSSLGYVVLTYDKRGVGSSGGVYQEFPSETNVNNLAGDAIGALKLLAARKDVDPARLGLHGASQAGWIIPRIAARSTLATFAVVVSGPAVSVGEQGLYAGITGQGSNNPTQKQIDEQLTGAEPSGFDPRPDLEKLSIPTYWLFGREDKVVYVPQTLEILAGLPTPPATKVFPRAGHFVLEQPHGLNSELTSSRRFAPGYFAAIAAWLRSL